MSKKGEPIDELMQWVDSPSDATLASSARQILDERFDDPKSVFAVAELAMRHREVSSYPLLDRIEGELFAELFSDQRRTTASNAELVQMGKLILDKKRMVIELASGDNAGEKPKIEIRVTPGDDHEGDASQFSPKQRERIRRALVALTAKTK